MSLIAARGSSSPARKSLADEWRGFEEQGVAHLIVWPQPYESRMSATGDSGAAELPRREGRMSQPARASSTSTGSHWRTFIGQDRRTAIVLPSCCCTACFRAAKACAISRSSFRSTARCWFPICAGRGESDRPTMGTIRRRWPTTSPS